MTARKPTALFISLLVVGFLFVPVHAAQIGPAFHNANSTATIDFRNIKGTYFDSISGFTSAVNSYLALCDDPGTGGTVTTTSSQVRVETIGVDCGNRQWSAGGTYYFGANFPSADPDCDNPAEWVNDTCPYVPPSCDNSITGTSFYRPGNAIGGGSVCHETSHCIMEMVNKNSIGSADLVRYVGTSNSCDQEPPVLDVYGEPQCITSGGDQWCTEPELADENCGIYNGDYVCLGAIPDGGCTFYGNGDMACSSSAGAPPAPDNGTPGTPAPPDGQIVTDTGAGPTTTNTYNQTTVAGSAGNTSGSTQEGDQPPEDSEITATIDPSSITEDFVIPNTAADMDSERGIMEAQLDSVISALGDPTTAFDEPVVGGGDVIKTALGSTSCVDISVPYPGGGGSALFSCSQLADFRAISGWILRMTLAMFAFNLVMTRPGS